MVRAKLARVDSGTGPVGQCATPIGAVLELRNDPAEIETPAALIRDPSLTIHISADSECCHAMLRWSFPDGRQSATVAVRLFPWRDPELVSLDPGDDHLMLSYSHETNRGYLDAIVTHTPEPKFGQVVSASINIIPPFSTFSVLQQFLNVEFEPNTRDPDRPLFVALSVEPEAAYCHTFLYPRGQSVANLRRRSEVRFVKRPEMLDEQRTVMSDIPLLPNEVFGVEWAKDTEAVGEGS